jgi:hypothetical protein
VLVSLLYNAFLEKKKMKKQEREQFKIEFKAALSEFVETLKDHVSTEDDQWTVKGFIDVFRNIYTISADTKIVSKILEIHLFPRLLEFATRTGYRIVLAEQQNYYPLVITHKSVSVIQRPKARAFCREFR